MEWPSSSDAVAAARIVSPSASKLCEGGSTVTFAADCSTVTRADPVAFPAAAVIVAIPPRTAVTRPFAATVATAGLEDDHATVTPLRTWPS